MAKTFYALVYGGPEDGVRLFPSLEKAQEAMLWEADTFADDYGEPTVSEWSVYFDGDEESVPELHIYATELEE